MFYRVSLQVLKQGRTKEFDLTSSVLMSVKERATLEEVNGSSVFPSGRNGETFNVGPYTKGSTANIYGFSDWNEPKN